MIHYATSRVPRRLAAEGERPTSLLRDSSNSAMHHAGQETGGMAFQPSSTRMSFRDCSVLKVGRHSPWQRARRMSRRYRSIGSCRPPPQNVEASETDWSDRQVQGAATLGTAQRGRLGARYSG